MIARLRHNLGYKLLAFFFACVLHFYVAGLINARPPHILILPLTLHNLPPNLILDEKNVPSVTLTLDGPTDEINRLTDATVSAWVDLSHARAGQTQPLPVHLTGLPGSVTLESDPGPVSLVLQTRRRRQLPVSADTIGVPLLNHTFGPPVVTPSEAMITGTLEAVDSVARLVAQADTDRVAGAVDEDFMIVALDSSGSPVSDVTVTPPTVHVRKDLVQVLSRKTLIVSANVVGTLPAPFRFGNIEVSPASVTVQGRPELLSSLGMLTTAPIDVSGATSDIVRRVEPVIPPGVTLSPRRPLTVTVHVIPPPVLAPLPAAKPSLPQ